MCVREREREREGGREKGGGGGGRILKLTYREIEPFKRAINRDRQKEETERQKVYFGRYRKAKTWARDRRR